MSGFWLLNTSIKIINLSPTKYIMNVKDDYELLQSNEIQTKMIANLKYISLSLFGIGVDFVRLRNQMNVEERRTRKITILYKIGERRGFLRSIATSRSCFTILDGCLSALCCVSFFVNYVE